MPFVIQWVSQILFFIMLATIVDLLMPSTSIKKYVLFVLKLILLYIYVQPIISFFSIQTHDLTSVVNRQFLLEEYKYRQIEKDYQTKSDNSDKNSFDLYIQPLEEELKASGNQIIRDLDGIVIDAVNVSYTFDATVNELDHIEVTLQDEGRSKVKEIKPVLIQKNKYDPAEEQSILEKEILTLLSEQWEIEKAMLSIGWE